MRRGLSDPMDLALLTRQLADFAALRAAVERVPAGGGRTDREAPGAAESCSASGARSSRAIPWRTVLRISPRHFRNLSGVPCPPGTVGKLDSVLERLSDYTESRQVMGQQVSNAWWYPIV